MVEIECCVAFDRGEPQLPDAFDSIIEKNLIVGTDSNRYFDLAN